MVPVNVEGVPFTCLIYTNDLAVKLGSPGLMIVPFPNPTGATRFGLIDGTSTSTFRSKAKTALVSKHTLMGRSLGTYGTNQKAASYEPVHDIGNYRCTIAPNIAALQSSIDWSKFNVPHDLEARLSVLHNSAIVPANSGFVIAEATASVKNDGFGIVFPGHHAFFPTCHEGPSDTHEYDVVCYGFNTILPRGDTHESETIMKDLHANFTPKAIWSHNGAAMAMTAEPFAFASVATFTGTLTNANVVGVHCKVNFAEGRTMRCPEYPSTYYSAIRPVERDSGTWAKVWAGDSSSAGASASASASAGGGSAGAGSGSAGVVDSWRLRGYSPVSAPAPAPAPAFASAPAPVPASVSAVPAVAPFLTPYDWFTRPGAGAGPAPGSSPSPSPYAWYQPRPLAASATTPSFTATATTTTATTTTAPTTAPTDFLDHLWK